MGTFAGPSMKVNRAISGGETVVANGYAVATYILNSITGASSSSYNAYSLPPIQVYFGPGQGIPPTFTTPIFQAQQSSAPYYSTITATYALFRGVEYVNSNV